MHGATVFEVADHRDVRAVDQLAHARELALDRVEIEHGLTGMFARSVAGIDDRDVGRACKLGDGTLLRMTHHQRIDVAAHHAAGVVDRLALGHRREGESRGVAHRAAEPAKGCPEAHPRARAGFEEQAAENGAFEDARDLLSARDRLHDVGNLEQVFEAAAVELRDRQQLRFTFGRNALHERPMVCAARACSGGAECFALQNLGDELVDHLRHRP